MKILTEEQVHTLRLIDQQIGLLEQIGENLRGERNRIKGLPAPPTVGALLNQMDALLADQKDCAEYLEADTREVSRDIYNESYEYLCHFNGSEARETWAEE